MVTPTYEITCTKKEQLTSDVFEVVFEKPEGFTFKAGQFVLFDTPLIENPSDIQTRAFSIASTPDESALLFCIKLVPGGRFSRFLEEKIEVGTKITMKGPFGFFTLKDAPDHSIVFACTSTGNAPFRSMILDAYTKGETRHMHLLFGVRSEADLFWLKEFEDLAKSNPAFKFSIALSKPSPTWKGLTGRIQHVLPDLVPDWSNTLLYLCGNPGMTKEVKTLAIEQWGMLKDKVHAEGYI